MGITKQTDRQYKTGAAGLHANFGRYLALHECLGRNISNTLSAFLQIMLEMSPLRSAKQQNL